MSLESNPACKECEFFYNLCLTTNIKTANVIVVGSCPTIFDINNNIAFNNGTERLIKNLCYTIKNSNRAFQAAKIEFTYAVRAPQLKVNTTTINICKQFLQRELVNIALKDKKPPVIIALGETALRALDYKPKKISLLYAKKIKIPLKTHFPQPTVFTVFVLPSTDFFSRNDGLLNTYKHVIETAIQEAVGYKLQDQNTEYRFPKTIDEVKELIDYIINYYNPNRKPPIGPEKWLISLDCETNGLHPYWLESPKIYMLSVSWDEGKAATIMLDHPETPYDPKEAWKHIDRLLSCPKPKAFHNWKFDLKFLQLVYGKEVNNVMWDSMLGEHYLDENKKGFYGLKKLVSVYIPELQGYEENITFDVDEEISEKAHFTKTSLISYIQKIIEKGDTYKNKTTEEWQTLLNKIKKTKTVSAALKQELKLLNIEISEKTPSIKPTSVADLQKYAAIDADVTRRIIRKQFLRLAGEKTTNTALDVMQNLYLPASAVLAEMEYTGIKVDKKKLQQQIDNIAQKITQIEKEIARKFDPTLNIRSQAQLAKQIVKLDLPPIKENVADKEVFATYLNILPQNDIRRDFCAAVLNFRSLHKLLFTYLIPLRDFANKDGKIHCSFHLNGTTTGRLSSSDPNMQNIPKIAGTQLSSEGKIVDPGFNLKEIFIPSSPEMVLCNIDIKAAELRTYCAYSKDAVMIDLLLNNKDPHSWVTAQVYNKTYEEIERLRKTDANIDKLRSYCKRIVFGTLYGAGPHKISVLLNISQDEAIALQKKIFEILPALPKYTEATKYKVLSEKRLMTFFGRYRRFPQLHFDSSYGPTAIREGINFLIQSTSSDLVISRICALQKPIKKLGGRLLITVHDSLLIEIPRTEITNLKGVLEDVIIKQVKEQFSWLPVPFLFDLECGENYGKLEKV